MIDTTNTNSGNIGLSSFQNYALPETGYNLTKGVGGLMGSSEPESAYTEMQRNYGDYMLESEYAKEDPAAEYREHTWAADALEFLLGKRNEIISDTASGKKLVAESEEKQINAQLPNADDITKQALQTRLKELDEIKKEADFEIEEAEKDNTFLAKALRLIPGTNNKGEGVSANFKMRENKASTKAASTGSIWDNLTDSEYWKYSTPGTMGTSFGDVSNYATMIGAAILKGVVSKVMQGAAVATGPTVIGPAVFGAASVAADVAGTALVAYGLEHSNRSEALAETFGASRDKFTDLLKQNNIDITKTLSDFRTQNPDLAKLSDQKLIDRYLQGRIDLGSPDLDALRDESNKNIGAVYDANRTLITTEVAEMALMFPFLGKMVSRIPGVKQVLQVGGAIGRSAKKVLRAERMAKEAAKWQLKLANRAALDATWKGAKTLGRFGLSSALEGVEEGAQNIINRNFREGNLGGYDADDRRKGTFIDDLANIPTKEFFRANKEMFKAKAQIAKLMLGFDNSSALAKDNNLWSEISGGVALGLLMGGLPTAVNTAKTVRGTYRGDKLYQTIAADNIDKQHKMYRVGEYAKKANSEIAMQRYYDVMESAKTAGAFGEVATDEEIDAEIEMAKRVQARVSNKASHFNLLAKAADFKKGSQEYNALLGLQEVSEDIVTEAKTLNNEETENYKKAREAYLKPLGEALKKAGYHFESSDEVKEGDPAPEEIGAHLVTLLQETNYYKSLLDQVKEAKKEGHSVGILNESTPMHSLFVEVLEKTVEQSEKMLTEMLAANDITLEQFQENLTTNGISIDLSNDEFGRKLSESILSSTLTGLQLNNATQLWTDVSDNLFRQLNDKQKEEKVKKVKQRVQEILEHRDLMDKLDAEEFKNALELAENARKEEEAERLEREEASKKAPATVDLSPTPGSTPTPGGSASPAASGTTPGPEVSMTPGEEVVTEVTPGTGGVAEKTDTDGETKGVGEGDDTIAAGVGEGDDTVDGAEKEESAVDRIVRESQEQQNGTESAEGAAERIAKLENDIQNIVDTFYNSYSYNKLVDDSPVTQTKREFEGNSNTLVYSPNSDKTMLYDYKSSKELAKFLNENPGVLRDTSKVKLKFFINTSYTPKGRTAYEAGNEDTYNNAAIMLEIVDVTNGNKYLMTISDPVNEETRANEFTDEKKKKTYLDALPKLRENRKEIIKAIEEGYDVTPARITATNGVYNQRSKTVEIDGKKEKVVVFRPITEVKGLGLPEKLEDYNSTNVKFGIGKGYKNQFSLVDLAGNIINSNWHAGSGNIFLIIPGKLTHSGNPVPVMINPLRFDDTVANIVLQLIQDVASTNSSYDNYEMKDRLAILNFIVNFGENTKLDPNGYAEWEVSKQFFTEVKLSADGTKTVTLHLGEKEYNVDDLSDEDKTAIIETLKTFHWNINMDTFGSKMNGKNGLSKEQLKLFNELFKETPYTITEYEYNNLAVMGWFAGHGLLTSDLNDKPMVNPFYYFDGLNKTKAADVPVTSTTSLSPTSTTTSTSSTKSTTTTKGDSTTKSDSGITSTDTKSETSDDSWVSKDDFEGVVNVTMLLESISKGDAIKKVLENYHNDGKKVRGFDQEDTPVTGAPRLLIRPIPAERRVTQKEKEWFNQALGLNAENLYVTEQAIELGNSTYAMGLCRLYSTLLWEGAEEGTLYHEAFHKVSLLLLSPKEKQRVYRFYRKANNVSDSVSDDRVEEMLAEGFRDYQLNNVSEKLNVVRRVFKTIKNFIKKWFNRSDYEIDQLYSRISTGYYANYQKNPEAVKEWLNKFQEGGSAPFTVNGAKFKHISNSQFENLIQTLTGNALTMLGIRYVKDLEKLDLDIFKFSFSPTTIAYLLKNNQITEQQANVFHEIYEHFDLFKDAIKKELTKFKIEFHKRPMDEETEAKTGENVDSEESNDDTSSRHTSDDLKYYASEIGEVSAKNSALPEVKFFIATLPNTRFKQDQTHDLENIKDPVTGMVTLVDYDKAWQLVSMALAHCTEFDEMLQEAKRLGEQVPLFQSLYLKMLDLTIAKENETAEDKLFRENMQTMLRTAFSKNTQSYLFAVSENKNGAVSLYFQNENINTLRAHVLESFSTGLRQSGLIKSNGLNTTVDTSKINEYKTVVTAINAAVQNPNLTKDNLPVIKNGIIKALSILGINVDLATVNKVLDYFDEVDHINAIKTMMVNTSRNDTMFYLSSRLDDLATANKPKNNTRGIFNIKNKEYNVDDFCKNSQFLKLLATAYGEVNPQYDEVAVLTTDGKLLYAITEKNFLGDHTYELNHNRETVLEANRTSYVGGHINQSEVAKESKGSSIINNLLKGKTFRVHTITGFKQLGSNDRGRRYKDISDIEDWVLKASLMLDGYYLLPTMGDSVTYNVLQGDAIESVDNEVFIDKDGGIAFSREALNRFVDYFEAELETIYYNYKNPPANPRDVIANYDTGKRGYRLRNFNGLRVSDKISDLNKYLDEHDDYKTEPSSNQIETIYKQWHDLELAEKQNRVNEYLRKAFNTEIEGAAKLGIVSWDGKHVNTVENILFPTNRVELLKNRIKDNNPTLSEEGINNYAILSVLANTYLNNQASLIEFEKLYAGDRAFYKSDDDYTKRLREVLSTGNTPRTQYYQESDISDLTEFTVGTLKDNVYPSRQIDELIEKATISYIHKLLYGKVLPDNQQQTGFETYSKTDIDKMIAENKVPVEILDQAKALAEKNFAGYRKVNQTDATVLISPEAYKQLMRRLHGWTPEMAKAFEILNDKADLLTTENMDSYKEALAVVLNPLKCMYYGMRQDDVHRRQIPIFDKMAMFPVFPIFATGDMKVILDRMQDRSNPIHMIAFESAVKVGQDAKSQMYQEDGATVNTESIKNMVTHQQPLKYFRQQMLTDPHDAGHSQMLVTQALKASMLNVRKDNVYTLPTGEQIKGDELLRQITDAIDKLTVSGWESVKRKFKVSDDKASRVAVREELRRNAETTHMNQNVMQQLSATRDDIVPISAMSDNSWMEASLISIINRDVINIKTPGGMFIQMSSVAYNKLDARTDGGVRNLAFDRDDNSVECVISINLFKDVIPDYDKKTFAQAKAWLKKAGVIGKNSKSVAMGYRVPAQGPSSVTSLTVVDVYPEQIADTITLPDEWTALTGSDYDIDKLYIARYNFDKEGNIIRPTKPTQDDVDEYNDTVAAGETKLNKEDFISNTKESRTKLVLFKRWFDKKQPSDEKIYQNRLLDLLIAMMTEPTQYAESKLPLDTVTDYLKNDILGDIDKLKGVKSSSRSDAQNDFLTLARQNEVKADLMAGKKNLAAFALANSHHALSQAVGLKFSSKNPTVVKYGLVQLDKIQSDKPNYHKGKEDIDVYVLISDWLSAMVNANVDVAKDPYINRLNVRKATLNTVNLLLRTGKGESTFYYMSQPILKDFADAFDKYDGYFGVTRSGSAEAEAMYEIREKYIKAYNDLGGDPFDMSLISNPLSQDFADTLFDIETLRKGLDKKNYGTKEWYKTQLLYLKAYEELQSASRALSEAVNIAQIDTKKFGNNFGLQQKFLLKLFNFVTGQTTLNGSDVISKTFLKKKLLHGLIDTRIIFSNLMLRVTPEFEQLRTKVYALINDPAFISDGTINAVTRMMESRYKMEAIIDTMAKQNNVTENKRHYAVERLWGFIYGDNTIAKRIVEIKQNVLSDPNSDLLSPDGGIGNILLDILQPTFSNNLLPQTLTLKRNYLNDENISDKIIRAWEELLESNDKDVKAFAQDLIYYAMLTSGDAFGKSNLFKYVPHSWRKSSGYYDYIQKLEKDPIRVVDYINEYDIVSNLWYNDEAVPPIVLTTPTFDETTGDVFNVTKPNVTRVLSNHQAKFIAFGKYTSATIPFQFAVNDPITRFKSNKINEVFRPYLKVELGEKNNPMSTFLYKLVGTTVRKTKDSEDVVPVYEICCKQGLNYRGVTIVEPSAVVGKSVDTFSMLFTENVVAEILKQKGVAGAIKNQISYQRIERDDNSTSKLEENNRTYLQDVIDVLDGKKIVKEFKNSKNFTEGNSISTITYDKNTAPGNRDTAIIYTENAQAAVYKQDVLNSSQNIPAKYNDYGFPNVQPTLNVRGNNNQAIVRTDANGNINENAFGIIVKKYQQNENGGFVAGEGQFQDTDEDFNMFKDLNTEVFNQLSDSEYKSRIFPHQLALGKSALPKRFAEWLRNELKERFGLNYSIQKNNTKGYDGFGLMSDDVVYVGEGSTFDLYAVNPFTMRSAVSDEIITFNTIAGAVAASKLKLFITSDITEETRKSLADIEKQLAGALTKDSIKQLDTQITNTLTPENQKKVQLTATGTLTDIIKIANDNATNDSTSQQTQNLPGSNTETNIWFSSNENPILSNMDNVPVTVNGVKFNTLEGAFQAAKLNYTSYYTDKQKQAITRELAQSDGTQAKQIGRKILGLNKQVWDRQSSDVMLELLFLKFTQNESAKQALLATGQSVLTHNQETTNSKWHNEFPRLLTSVREKLQSVEKIKSHVTKLMETGDKPFVVGNEYSKTEAKVIKKAYYEARNELNNSVIKDVTKNQFGAERTREPMEPTGHSFKFSDKEIPTMFDLNEQQRQALRNLEDFYNDPNAKIFSLQGYAGTGKTSIMRVFDEWLFQSKGVSPVYTALTHTANMVTVKNNPFATASTVASLFKGQPKRGESLVLNTEDLDYKGLDLKKNTVIICDECSMIGKKEYKMMMRALDSARTRGLDVKIIFMGDSAQLNNPSDKAQSPTFDEKNYEPKYIAKLTKVERTGDNAILKECTRVRSGEGVSYVGETNEKGQGVTYVRVNKSEDDAIVNNIMDMLTSNESANDNAYVKALFFRNDNVDKFNTIIRNARLQKLGLNPATEPFIRQGELLLAYNNKYPDFSGDGGPLVKNSVEYRVISAKRGESTNADIPQVLKNLDPDDPRTTDRQKQLNALTSEPITYMKVTLKVADSTIDETTPELKIVEPNDSNYARLTGIANLADSVIQDLQGKARQNAIGDFYSWLNQYEGFTDLYTVKVSKRYYNKNTNVWVTREETGCRKKKMFNYAYALTVHKSQGGTYNNVVFYGTTDLLGKRTTDEEKTKLIYVGVSRAKDHVYYITDNNNARNIQNSQTQSDIKEFDKKGKDLNC